MTNDQFIALDASLLRKAEAILNQRKAGYATQDDRLANFKEGAKRSGITPLQVCHLYLQKGLSVVDKIAQGTLPPGETIEERICDAINYLRLFYACYKEGSEDVPETMEYVTHAPSVSSKHDEVAKALDRMPQYPGIARVPGARCATPHCNNTSIGGPVCHECLFARAEDGRKSFT